MNLTGYLIFRFSRNLDRKFGSQPYSTNTSFMNWKQVKHCSRDGIWSPVRQEMSEPSHLCEACLFKQRHQKQALQQKL